ncbi:hypothetical protein D9M68_791510 [compost metagenome]
MAMSPSLCASAPLPMATVSFASALASGPIATLLTPMAPELAWVELPTAVEFTCRYGVSSTFTQRPFFQVISPTPRPLAEVPAVVLKTTMPSTGVGAARPQVVASVKAARGISTPLFGTPAPGSGPMVSQELGSGDGVPTPTCASAGPPNRSMPRPSAASWRCALRLFLPRAEAISDAATQAPSASFQMDR